MDKTSPAIDRIMLELGCSAEEARIAEKAMIEYYRAGVDGALLLSALRSAKNAFENLGITIAKIKSPRNEHKKRTQWRSRAYNARRMGKHVKHNTWRA